MTPRIITYFLCGMRHPTTGLSEDDLSRLTGSSSSTSSSSSSSASSSSSSSSRSSAANTPKRREIDDDENGIHPLHTNQNKNKNQRQHNSPERTSTSTVHKNNLNNSHNNGSTHFSSTYLPEIINPLEWQKSRKRKERLDSTSASTQERKLQRSNSEELLSEGANVPSATVLTDVQNGACRGHANEAMRRVSSEDFKRSGYEPDLPPELGVSKQAASLVENAGESSATKTKEPIVGNENDGSMANLQQQRHQQHQQSLPLSAVGGDVTKDLTCRTRYETSPARSHRHSPVRGGNNGNGRHRDSDDSECEHERRRSSERSCKSRQPPGRKAAGVTKKNSSSSGLKYLPSKRSDESAYKYDLSVLKYERRGFISKKTAEKMIDKTPTGVNDHNDNSLMDFHQPKRNANVVASSPTSSSSPSSDDNTLTNTTTTTTIEAGASNPVETTSTTKKSSNSGLSFTSAQESLPWEREGANEDEPAPILSRRYAHSRHHIGESIDTAAKLAKVMPYPQPLHKQVASAALLADDTNCLEPLDAVRAFSSLENIRTRDVMQQVLPAMIAFQTPEERLKLVNRRITALKKKLTQLEEALETRLGYRPSQAERLNDKYMKNVLAELSKLRKERHELKSDHDPTTAFGVKVSGGMDAAMKLESMKTTLSEVEQNLTDKRKDGNRTEVIDELTPAQLVQEKSAVQHGLLYFESLYGRPVTKDERDAARPLYERYRQLKRMVSRTNLFSGVTGAGAPDLPTILEHEAMVFESTPLQYSSNNSSETTNSPSDTTAATANTASASSEESSSTTTTTTTNTTGIGGDVEEGKQAVPANENISSLSLEELWKLLDLVREEKKLLKQTIHEYECIFEEQNGRKMLKNDRRAIETYGQYKEKKAKTRLLQALIKKHISR